MFNPSMFNEARKNMSKEQLQQAANMMANMSDADLINYAKMAGMPTADPNVIRQNIKMMQSMTDEQFNAFKNMAQNVNYPFMPTQSQTATSSAPSSYPEIEKLKNKGNEHFKKGEYDAASASYLEAIIEIEDIRSKNRNLRDEGLDNLEISCRLNYANAKAKLSDFEAVLTHAKAALNIRENGKAYYRVGQALHHLGKHKQALTNLEKAKAMLNDEQVIELYNKVKEIVGENQEETQNQTNKKEQDIYQSKEEESNKGTKRILKKKNAPEVDSSFAKNTPKEKIPSTTTVYNSNPDVTIEEEEKSSPKTSNASYQPSSTGFPNGMDPEQLKKGQEQFKNMSPEQIKMMTEAFKNMDNSFIKQMMKQQTGMDMKDEDIERMKSMMTPEMLQSFAGMDMSQFQNAGAFNQAKNSQQQQPGTTPTAMPTNFSDMAGMASGLSGDTIKNMMAMLQQNPEMLKTMASMLGENHPLAKMIQNKSPEELRRMIGWMQKAVGVFGFFSPVIKVVKSYWQLILGVLIGYILYRIFS